MQLNELLIEYYNHIHFNYLKTLRQLLDYNRKTLLADGGVRFNYKSR